MSNVIIAKDPKKGRMVIANRDFEKDEMIEYNHVLTYPFLPNEHPLLDWSMEWSDTEDALALGHINLLNHSEQSNVYLVNDFKEMTKTMYAKKAIKKDEELIINYDCELWFDVVP